MVSAIRSLTRPRSTDKDDICRVDYVFVRDLLDLAAACEALDLLLGQAVEATEQVVDLDVLGERYDVFAVDSDHLRVMCASEDGWRVAGASREAGLIDEVE